MGTFFGRLIDTDSCIESLTFFTHRCKEGGRMLELG